MDVVPDRRGCRGLGGMPGPLTALEDEWRAELVAVGYGRSSVAGALQYWRALDRWMAANCLAVADLTEARVDEFLTDSDQSSRGAIHARRWLGGVWRFLLERGLVRESEPVALTSLDALLVEFAVWLRNERGLADASVRSYRIQAHKFLVQLRGPLDDALAGLDAVSVTTFMVNQTVASPSVWSAKALVTAMRSLLRFLHVDGRIPMPLIAAVPGVAGWRLSGLPRGLMSGQVDALLAAHDLTDPVGLRDHAILVTLARLGLRGAEVASINLRDIDWHAGEIVVLGKGSRLERLPLPAEVGAALAAYLSNSRPSCSCATVFVTARAPFRSLTPGAVRAIMGRACRHAGLPRLGAHRLRHTLATGMLAAGAPLTEIGQVLRHRSQLSTAIYAKVDFETLRTLARPWPGELS